MTGLRVSPDLELPRQLVTHRNALIGMSGSGKSNAFVVLAEEMHRAEVPWCLFDPKGDAYGIRSSADGKGSGLDVPIIGGDHADLPLSPRVGARMAELVAAGKLAGVFDLSDFAHERQELARFMADFGTTLLAQQKTPIHLFLDEADEYLPQPGAGGRLEGNVAACVAAWKRVSTKGRQKGIGYTLVSQRPALVSKTALYQCETLIAMRTSGKRDRTALRDFVEAHGQADELVDSLPSLEDGEAWIWSPVRLRMMQRIRFRRRATFDSGRTPELGEAVVAPKLAKLDLEALRAELVDHEFAEVGEDEKPSSSRPNGYPQQLAQARGRIAELERELVAKPGFDADKAGDLHLATISLVDQAIGTLERARGQITGLFESYAREASGSPVERSAAPIVHRDAKPSNGAALRVSPSPAPARSAPPPRTEKPNGAPTGLPKGEETVLVAIAQHRDGVTREQLTVLTGYKKSTRDLYVQKLKQAGLVTAAGLGVQATDAGRRALGTGWKPLPTGAKLRAYWLDRLPAGERAVLEVLVAAHPKWVTRDRISEATNYRKSTRDLYIQKLRSRRLATDAERGGVKASDELF